MIIYMIRNRLTGKMYIGQTRRSLTQRWSHHKCAAERNDTMYIHRAMMEHGPTKFEILALDSRARTIEELNALERYYIRLLDTLAPNGYNLTTGSGNGVRRGGWHHSPASKSKIANANLGRKATPELRAKLSLSHRGKRQPCLESTRIKISESKRRRDAENLANVVLPTQAQAIRLIEVEGLTVDQTAARLGLTRHQVARCYYYKRKKSETPSAPNLRARGFKALAGLVTPAKSAAARRNLILAQQAKARMKRPT
jgi:group I intron endonuclease